jgi:hypothetical protein
MGVEGVGVEVEVVGGVGIEGMDVEGVSIEGVGVEVEVVGGVSVVATD